jgi:DNA/RNA-binding domain of Phe-tRNA-synthetase-like protein
MEISVCWNAKVAERFPELAICVGTINNVHIENENVQIQRLKQSVYAEIKGRYNIEKLRDNGTVRAYRDFYWKLGIDPTKTRPSGEALLRRVLHGDELPRISNVVDAYNLASMETIIPISGFDRDRLKLPFHVRFAVNDETFVGISMSNPMSLMDKMLVLADQKRVLCVYPYRDSDHTKITESTRNVLIIGYGAVGIDRQELMEAVKTTLAYIKLVSGGEIEMIKVFSCER